MAIATSGEGDPEQSSFSTPLQSLLSHLPSLSTALPSSSHTADSQATTAQSSRCVSISSAHTAVSKEHSAESQSPSPVTPLSSNWTAFHFAHPPPRSRTHGHRRHSYPPLLLQLRRTPPGGRIPRPDLEVYPIVGSIRKEKHKRPVTCGGHELSKEDLVVLRYSTEEESNTDFPPLGLQTTALDCNGIVAILHHCMCSAELHAPQNIIFVHGSAWLATLHPDGGYAFLSQDNGVMRRVCWLPRRSKKRFSRAATTPLPSTAVTRPESLSVSDFAFFPTAGAEAGKTDGCYAQIDMSAIHVHELPDIEVSDMKTAAGLSQTHLTTLAVATGLWVANREGWVDLGLHTGIGSAVGSMSVDSKSASSHKTSRTAKAKVLKLVHRRRASR